MPPVTFPLLDLSDELVDKVCEHWIAEDLCDLRSCCKSLSIHITVKRVQDDWLAAKTVDDLNDLLYSAYHKNKKDLVAKILTVPLRHKVDERRLAAKLLVELRYHNHDHPSGDVRALLPFVRCSVAHHTRDSYSRLMSMPWKGGQHVNPTVKIQAHGQTRPLGSPVGMDMRFKVSIQSNEESGCLELVQEPVLPRETHHEHIEIWLGLPLFASQVKPESHWIPAQISVHGQWVTIRFT